MSFDKIPPRTYVPFRVDQQAIQPFFSMLRERKLTNADIGDSRQLTKQPIKEKKIDYSTAQPAKVKRKYKKRTPTSKSVRKVKTGKRKVTSKVKVGTKRLEKKIKKAKV